MRNRAWPTLLPVIAGAVLVALFVRLGLWQLERAAGKQATEARFEQALVQPPQVMDRFAPRPRFTPVVLVGRFLPQVIYLDNQLHEGRPGVHVFAPFQPAAGGPQVLVNLGWLPIGPRRELPALEPARQPQRLAGMLSKPPPVGLRLGDGALGSPPYRVPYLDLETVAERLNLQLAPQILLATGKDASYVRNWRPATAMPSERHRAYAFQWFALAVAVAILTAYGVWRITRKP